MIRVTSGSIKEVVTGKHHYVKGNKRRIILVTCPICGSRIPEGTECLICKKNRLAN